MKKDVPHLTAYKVCQSKKQAICPVCGRKFPENLVETLCYQCKEAASAGEDMNERKRRNDEVRQQYLYHAQQFGLEDEPNKPARKSFCS